jgi:hypothetical protein
MEPTLDPREGPAGTLYVSPEAERGSKAPFLVAYADAAGDERWGYFCTNCETFDNAMDSMGRIQCNGCENFKRPDEWDAAHE